MKTSTAFVLASFFALVAAAPIETSNAAECEAEAASTTSSTSSCSVITTTIMQAVNAGATSAPATTTAATAGAAGGASGNNVQKFTGTLGGAPPPVISSAGDRPFSVNGNTFVGAGAAIGRSCDIQHNACANAANSGKLAGGVGLCETQVAACRATNSATAAKAKRQQALDLGTCSDASIAFKSGLDGRNQPAFIAANQKDFNHGSALGIGIIADFICQRLGSPCNAPADVQASCSRASAAAVATTQNQAAADAFNAIMAGGGSGDTAAPVVSATASATTSAAGAPQQTGGTAGVNTDECDAPSPTTADLASTTLQAVVMTITSCS